MGKENKSFSFDILKEGISNVDAGTLDITPRLSRLLWPPVYTFPKTKMAIGGKRSIYKCQNEKVYCPI